MIATKAQPKAQQEKAPSALTSLMGSPAPQTNNSATTCVVSKGTHIDGYFNCTENIRLDGSVKGELYCEKRLVMGSTGMVEGRINTQDADISGTIEGDLVVANTLTLRATAQVRGTLSAKYLNVEEGAVYNGDCKIG